MERESAATAATIPLQTLRPKRSIWRNLAHIAKAKPLGAISLVVTALLILLAVIGPYITPYDPIEPHYIDKLQPPNGRYWFGTDQLGRDQLSRIIWGARISISVGFLAVAFGTVGGTVVGIVSAFFKRADMVIQRLMDALMAFPGLILLLVLVSVMGSGLIQVMFAIGIMIAPRNGRVVRGAVLSVMQNQYVEAARAVGAGDLRIMIRHVLPNVMAPIIILASVMLGGAILMEATLSFLGLGPAEVPYPTWGGMLNTSGRANMEHAPWLALFPGFTISIAVLTFNIFGDTLRDILDPRLRGSF